jgi:Zn-dependent protease
LGSIFAILFVAAYSVTGIQWFLAAGFMGVLLNLFNMIPVTPFDGGRVMQIASKWCNVVGMAILVIITIALKVPTLLVVWMLAIFDMNVIGSKLRIILMSVIEVAMVYMLCTGIGIEGKATFWWMLVDVILGLAFVVAMLLSVVWVGANETNTILNVRANRPLAPVKDRVIWAIIWLITTALLIWCVMLLAPLIKVHNLF